VASAIRRLDKSTAPRRVMVLFTDGKNNVNHRLTPLATAELAKEKNILIYTVGIGGNNAFMLQNDIFGKRYVRYPGEFDEKLLQDMANTTGGKYFKAADEQAMNDVMQEINALEKTNITQPRPVHYREFAPIAALLALAVLLFGQIAGYTWKMRLP
jgi:Ca-activated chloride channel family protein